MADINSTNLSTEAPDFSMLALFMQADIVVKSVIIILILASLYSCLLYTSDAADE